MRLSSCVVALPIWSSPLGGQAAYQREFGQTIEHPAIYDNPLALNCLGNRPSS